MSNEREARQQLVSAIAEILTPLIVKHGFRPKGSKARKATGTSTQYFRERENRFDFLHIDWKPMQRPYFIVEFDSVRKDVLPSDFEPTDVEFWEQFVLRYRLSRCALFQCWFGVGVIGRRIAPMVLARRAAYLAGKRLELMDRFLRQQQTSPYVWGGHPEDFWAKANSLDDAVIPWRH